IKRAKYPINSNNCETKQSFFLTLFVRLGFSQFGAYKPNILTTTGIENAENKTLMQDKMRHNQRTIEA
ncbi:hypothetical protein, partial [Aliivibrio fischeri]|uniref:hypothetical protein n=1 Tax=Aliivibrio fischeri TaxID=668 RepID=UPI001F1A2D22